MSVKVKVRTRKKFCKTIRFPLLKEWVAKSLHPAGKRRDHQSSSAWFSKFLDFLDRFSYDLRSKYQHNMNCCHHINHQKIIKIICIIINFTVTRITWIIGMVNMRNNNQFESSVTNPRRAHHLFSSSSASDIAASLLGSSTSLKSMDTNFGRARHLFSISRTSSSHLLSDFITLGLDGCVAKD